MALPSHHLVGQVNVDGATYPIELNRHGFEIRIGEHVAVLRAHTRGDSLALIHTEVPPALRRKGLAEALARTGLDYARAQGMKVKPYCPFVASYVARHSQYGDLVDADFPA